MVDYVVSVLHILIFAVCSCRSIDVLQPDDLVHFTDNMSTQQRSVVSFDHYSYCNHHKSVTGQEGTEIAGYSLQQVHIVLSPGISDSSTKVKNPDLWFPPMSCDSINSSSLKDFKEMADTYKEISRNHHFHHLHPSFPKVCANDHLTSLGFEQLISVGQHLGARYFQQRVHKRLQPKYSSVHVESISSEKSYHSVLAFLYGFLAEKQLFKTKIHKANMNFCEFMESDLPTCTCSKTRDLAPHISQSLTKGTFMFKSSFPNTEIMSEVLNTNISGPTSALELFRTLMQYRCDSTSLHCPKDVFCGSVDEDKLSKLHAVLSDHRQSLHMDSVFRSYSELRVYPFLEQILSRATGRSDQQPVNVYMGHSHFLQYVTSTLGVFRKQVTPPASRFVIEVYKKNGGQIGQGQLYLRYLYNGYDVTHEVSACTFHTENTLCNISGLKTLTEALRTQYLNEC